MGTGDRLDPGYQTIISGTVTANAGTGTFTVTNESNKALLVDDRQAREALIELWAAIKELQDRLNKDVGVD